MKKTVALSAFLLAIPSISYAADDMLAAAMKRIAELEAANKAKDAEINRLKSKPASHIAKIEPAPKKKFSTVQKEIPAQTPISAPTSTTDSELALAGFYVGINGGYVGAEKRLALIADDIVKHFEARQEALAGKAMIVCMSRRICVALYDAIIKLRPEWHSDDDEAGALKLVMTGAASDPLEWQTHIGKRPKARRELLAKRAKRPDDPLKLVIVRDMWLTGFDAPCMHTMYIDKPMKGHGLMQAIETPDISVLSDEFLAEVRDMDKKNLAIEALKKLINGNVRSQARRNVTQSKTFTERLEAAIARYHTNAITTAEVLEELIKLAKDIRAARARGEETGLSYDEIAFYDALADNESARQVMGEPALRVIAHELVQIIKANISVDWMHRNSARANIRRHVKRLLRKYGYPPDLQDAAVQNVLQQAEALSADWAA